jgi:pectate lyase-like protein
MLAKKTMKPIPRLLLAAAALLLAPAAFATTYYVATTGSDTAAGTLAAPFKSITKAQSVAVSGDTVLVRGGTYSSFTVASSDANYHYVHQLSKSGITYSNYSTEVPIFNFASVPTDLRVCGFHITTSGISITGFVVTGTPVGSQKQSECFRIDGSAAACSFTRCVAHDNAANGFYFTNHATGSCTNCDSYNNIGPTSASIGNTDGFGAHGNGVTFTSCRSWHNSDDGFDCIASYGANTFDHCWAYNMTAGGDSNGFKVGGWGTTTPPASVPAHTVKFCLSANNNAHGFYANHQPGKAATWTSNTSYNNAGGDFDMLERVSVTDATDISGTREVLHNNIAYKSTLVKDDADPAAQETNNSWTLSVTVNDADFQSTDATQMTTARPSSGALPTITFMHLVSGSDLAGLGCF